MFETAICFLVFGILGLILIPFMPLLATYFFSGMEAADQLA